MNTVILKGGRRDLYGLKKEKKTTYKHYLLYFGSGASQTNFGSTGSGSTTMQMNLFQNGTAVLILSHIVRLTPSLKRSN